MNRDQTEETFALSMEKLPAKWEPLPSGPDGWIVGMVVAPDGLKTAVAITGLELLQNASSGLLPALLTFKLDLARRTLENLRFLAPKEAP